MWTAVESVEGEGPGEAPCGRGKHSATLLGGHVYVLGGRGAGGSVPLRDFWRYCLADGRWERLSGVGPSPPALQEHSATAHGSRLYVFGGEPGAISGETPLWIYDAETETWRKLPGCSKTAGGGRRRTVRCGAGGAGGGAAGAGGPRGRRGHSAHALKDCLLVYGGYMDLKGSTNELWAFHYESETWQSVRTASGGPARHRHAAALHRARLYVHGGQCDLRDCADLWHYDTISRVWTSVRTPAKLSPSARSGHAGLRAGAHLYIFGGEAAGHPTDELWRFHFASETWERISQGARWPPARVDARALLVCGAGGRLSGAHAPRGGSPPATPAPPAPAAPDGRLLARLAGLRVRRGARCAYSALAPDRDSTESLVRHEAALSKSLSAYAIEARRPPDGDEGAPHEDGERRRRHLPKSASVRFTREAAATADEEDVELSTSDYASADGASAASGPPSLGFSNPHYLGPDVRALRAALTPDSGLGPGPGAGTGPDDVELRELGTRRARSEPRAPARLLVLVVGGREPAHPALLRSPLSMWTYRLL